MNPENPPAGGLQQQYQDFVNRYQQGPQGISEQEAATRYEQVASQLPREDYLRAAQEAFARMSPEERSEFGRYMARQAQQQGYDFIDLNQDGIDDRLQDPDYLARTTTRAHEQQPGLLGQLLGGSGGHGGGGTGGILGSPIAKGVLGGIAAYGISRMLGGGGHGLFGKHHHRHHGRHGHHGGFEADDLFEGGDDEGFFGGGGFFGGDDD